MKKTFYLLLSIFLIFDFTISAYSEQTVLNESTAIISNNPIHYEETESVVFADNKAYFKFNDPDVATTIIKNRWSKDINYTFTEKSIIYSYTYDQSSVINGSLEHVNRNIDLLPEHIREVCIYTKV